MLGCTNKSVAEEVGGTVYKFQLMDLLNLLSNGGCTFNDITWDCPGAPGRRSIKQLLAQAGAPYLSSGPTDAEPEWRHLGDPDVAARGEVAEMIKETVSICYPQGR
jgi:hypothetical protein